MPLLLAPRDDRIESSRLTSVSVHPTAGVLLVDPRDLDDFNALIAPATHDTSLATPHPGDRVPPSPAIGSAAALSLTAGGASAIHPPPPIPEGDSAAADDDDGGHVPDVLAGDADPVDGITPMGGVAGGDGADRTSTEWPTQLGPAPPSSCVTAAPRSRLKENPLTPLDSHTPLGRDRPLKAGVTWQ